MSDDHFEAVQKNIRLRNLKKKDYKELIRMQQECFPGMEVWSKAQYRSQLERFPEGQFCIEYEGQIAASCSSLIIDFDPYTERRSWAEICDHGYIRNHNPEGDSLYGIEIMVSPRFRGMKLARRLYEARKELAREKNLMRIVIGGRLPGYAKYQDEMTVREYVEKVQTKSLYDPVLTAQLANAFTLKRIIKNYLGEDKASAGYATFLEWTNLDYAPAPEKRYLASRAVRICTVQYGLRTITDFDDFARQVEYFVNVASEKKSDYVLFPELVTSQMLSFLKAGRPEQSARELAKYTPQYLELFSGLAIRYNINIIGGSTFVVEEERLYNVAFLFERNGSVQRQYKLHITPDEKRWWGVEGGDDLRVFSTDRGRICLLPGYDIEFPELGRLAVEKGARLFFVPFCADERQDFLRLSFCARARAVENEVYVVTAGTVGNLPHVENMDIQYAESAIYTPSDYGFARDGVAAQCTPEAETVAIQDLDLEALNRHRQEGTTTNWNDRRLDLYSLREKVKKRKKGSGGVVE
ncbi:MAG: bifunctional GNAT family N-acetyltransferase/carbon-nitrogen hydrolase family protein [Opitutales bacterium]|nr:bifunctional GNAT family N-acetyltransferase/carbon-nitrogen hydrolase family protein [Opitutales bacterium]